jgi:excisionase family DNA binding protein
MRNAEWNRVSVATAARLLGVPQKRVRQLLLAGKLKGEKVGRIWEVQEEQLPKQMLLPFEKYCAGGRDGREKI